jgi:AcrR family transcriptional regulator
MSPRNPAPTRAAIVSAAGALLEQGGLEAVTLRSVGAASGVSRSAPYRHFDDKSDLLRALALRTLTDLSAHMRQAAERNDQGTRLHRGCVAYLRYALEWPHHYQLIFGDTPMPQPPPEIESAADDGMLALRELVEDAQVRDELVAGPPRELATIVWALLHGLAHLQITGHLHEPRTIDGDTRLEDLLAVALTALRPTNTVLNARKARRTGREDHAGGPSR